MDGFYFLLTLLNIVLIGIGFGEIGKLYFANRTKRREHEFIMRQTHIWTRDGFGIAIPDAEVQNIRNSMGKDELYSFVSKSIYGDTMLQTVNMKDIVCVAKIGDVRIEDLNKDFK